MAMKGANSMTIPLLVELGRREFHEPIEQGVGKEQHVSPLRAYVTTARDDTMHPPFPPQKYGEDTSISGISRKQFVVDRRPVTSSSVGRGPRRHVALAQKCGGSKFTRRRQPKPSAMGHPRHSAGPHLLQPDLVTQWAQERIGRAGPFAEKLLALTFRPVRPQRT